MKTSSLLTVGAFAAGAVAQTFEDPNFNVTEALLDNGFDISAIPELEDLAGLEKRTLLSPCAIACKSLKVAFGSSKLLEQGTTAYTDFHAAYWSKQQSTVSPYCVVKPSSSLEVSTTVLISRLTQCPFAVKGGSHAAWAGASSIEGGITISMENLNHIKVSADKNTADIGPGNRWAATFEALEKQGVAVVGGRMAPVGVPGLILGGGISFFSNKLGWACDNVAEFEVVTASGIIVKATPTKFSDLYWALRGGGNNFGIVTNFKLFAFEQGLMWGGQRIYTENNFPAVKDAIFKFGTEDSSKDLSAAQLISFTQLPGIGNVGIAQIHYTEPVANASIFDDFNAITAVKDSTGIRKLSELAHLMNEGSEDTGLRQVHWDITLKPNRALFDSITEIFYAALPSIADIEGIFPVISLQAITEGQLKGMQSYGGNALGLTPAKGPLFIMNMSGEWKNAVDDERVYKFFNDVTESIRAHAASQGLDNEYIYQNYASMYQDPIATYGAANVQRLQAISKKYDPRQVFQKLQPGGFKLSGGAPNKTPL